MIELAQIIEEPVWQCQTLVWQAPLTREDGTPFDMTTDGGAYELLIIEPGGFETRVWIDKGATSLDISAYPMGTLFEIRACDKCKNCSEFSPPVDKGDTSAPEAPIA